MTICFPRTSNHTTTPIYTFQEDGARTRYAPSNSNLVKAGVTASRTADRSAQNAHLEGRTATAGGELLRLEVDGIHPLTDFPSAVRPVDYLRKQRKQGLFGPISSWNTSLPLRTPHVWSARWTCTHLMNLNTFSCSGTVPTLDCALVFRWIFVFSRNGTRNYS